MLALNCWRCPGPAAEHERESRPALDAALAHVRERLPAPERSAAVAVAVAVVAVAVAVVAAAAAAAGTKAADAAPVTAHGLASSTRP